MGPAVIFDNVSKKFRRGERHDSFRDLLPSLVRRAFRQEPAGTLHREEFWALRNVSFSVKSGEALGIIGANGAGKSTALKVLTRILRPTSGRCQTHGRVGALIEVAAGFHPDLTGTENVYLQGAIMGMKRAEITERFDEIVDFAGIAEFMNTPVKRYSSGMNARLGFSIAAHLRPDVLIIDEVLSVGDMAFQQKCFERMLDYKRKGIAIVLVSHNLQAVSALCENTVFLAGSVQAAGPTAEVLEAYVKSLQNAKHGSEHGPVEITTVSIQGPDGPVVGEVAPGTSLTLSVSMRTSAALDDVTFGFLIHRSTDQLLVYDGNIHRRELGDAAAFGGVFTLEFHFRPHLVRGHYYLSVHVFDNPTQTFLLRHRQVGTLAVHERRSWGGVADINLSATLREAVSGQRPAPEGIRTQ